MLKLTSGKYTLHYRVSGQGNPVFLLHGFLEDHTMWESIVPSLVKQGCIVYVFDLPCHGLSRFSGEICEIDEVASVLASFCTNEKIINPSVFGHSMGGYIGLSLLEKMPIRLTLVHSNFWEDSPTKKEDRNRVVDAIKKYKTRFIQEAIPNLFAPQNKVKCAPYIKTLIQRATQLNPSEISAATRGMRDRTEKYELMNKHEVMLIQGEDDPIIPTNLLTTELDKLKRQPQCFIIRSCGHMSIWEDPEKLINLMNTIIFR